MEQPIISVSGLRGVIGRSLTCSLAMRYATAFASKIDQGPIVVTRDGRTTGKMLANAICAALNEVGRKVLYGDVAATPTTGILVREHGAAGGIQISASHNPPEYNGIKLFSASGRVVSADQGERVKSTYHTHDSHHSHRVEHFKVGELDCLSDTTSMHLAKVLSTINVRAVRDREFRVLLNCNHGAGSVMARALFEELNVRAQLVGGVPDGLFDSPPEPTAANLQDFSTMATTGRFDVCFAQDPDADRLAIIDEQGGYPGEEMTLAIVLKHALERNPGPVVINCATSRMAIDIAHFYRCPCYLSAVGEANVCDMMIEVNAVYGGEGNGGPIDPRVGFVRDSFVGMAQILDRMAFTRKSISELVEEMPEYAIQKSVVQLDPSKIPRALDALQSQFPNAVANRMDGLRLDWEDQWLLVRASNTEPIVRIIAESGDKTRASELCQMAQQLIQKI